MRKILMMIMIAVMLSSLCACKPAPKPILSEEGIKGICEQASLKCFYNNVAKIEKDPENIFQRKREMWIEYEGVVTLGIEMDELLIEVSDNTVTLVLPEVRVLSSEIARINQDSYVASSDGWLIKNPISTEEQNEAVNMSQEMMENAVKNDAGLFAKAKQSAKSIIENYINWLGEIGNQEYTIIWKEQGV